MKLKRLLAAMLAAVTVLGAGSLLASAVESPDPEENPVLVDLIVPPYEEDGEAPGHIFFVNGAGQEVKDEDLPKALEDFNKTGGMLRVEAAGEDPNADRFLQWEVHLKILDEEDKLWDLEGPYSDAREFDPNSGRYQDDGGTYAFSNITSKTQLYSGASQRIRLNRVYPEGLRPGDTLVYQVVARFTREDVVEVPVYYTYNGKRIHETVNTYIKEEEVTVTPAGDLDDVTGFEPNQTDMEEKVKIQRDDKGFLQAEPKAVTFAVKPSIDPKDFRYHVTFQDAATGEAVAEEDVSFKDVGQVEREKISLPQHYLLQRPKEVGYDWLYPVGLTYNRDPKVREWQVIPTEIVIPVEEECHTTITYQDAAGTVLGSYKEYYTAKGERTLKAKKVPTGYKIEGSNTFMVDVTEAEGRLTADPTEVIFRVVSRNPETTPPPASSSTPPASTPTPGTSPEPPASTPAPGTSSEPPASTPALSTPTATSGDGTAPPPNTTTSPGTQKPGTSGNGTTTKASNGTRAVGSGTSSQTVTAKGRGDGNPATGDGLPLWGLSAAGLGSVGILVLAWKKGKKKKQ